MPMYSNEARHNLLPNEPIESFWDVLWFGIQPFLCFMVGRLAHPPDEQGYV